MEKKNKMEETKETQESLQRKREQALQRLRKERTEEALWDCVTAYQDFEFHTYSGLPYSYHMKYGRSGTYTKELWINRREKSKRKNCSADSRTKIAGKINFLPMQVLTTTHWVI